MNNNDQNQTNQTSINEYPQVTNYKNLNNNSPSNPNNTNNINNNNNNNSGSGLLSALGDSFTALFRSNSSNSIANSHNNTNNNTNNININSSNNKNIPSPTTSPLQSPQTSQKTYNKTMNGKHDNLEFANVLPANSPQSSTSSLITSPPIIDDFVVLSEFSEQSGPVALNLIPEQFLFGSTFDLAKFSGKVMTMDFQNKTFDLKTYAKDSNMFYTVTNSDNNEVYAYVHHFSLFDIQARGYVRPLVLSYLTRNPNKIIKYFDKFLYYFSQLTTLLKSKNHILFETEYLIKKRDLEFTLAHYQDLRKQEEEQEQQDQSDSNSNNITQGNNTSKQSLLEMTILSITEAISELHSIETLFENERKSYHQSNSMGLGLKEKPTPFFMESSIGTIYFSHDPIQITIEPKLIDILNKTGHLDRALRHVSEICPLVFERFVHKLEQTYKYFSRSSLQMEFDILDSQSHLPSSSLLTIGHSSILNFGLEIDQNKSNSHNNNNKHSKSKDINRNQKASASLRVKSPSNNSLDSYSSDPSSYLSVLSSTSLNEHFDIIERDNSTFSNNSSISTISNNINNNNINVSTSSFNNNQNQNQNFNTNTSNLNLKLETFSNYLWANQKRPEYGKGLLRFSKFSWLRHVVFSLLKGRTVVIVGSSDKESVIISMVYALSIFAVGQTTNNSKTVFESYRTTPLSISDLSHLKLVGMPKQAPKNGSNTCNNLIPSNVSHFISKVDLDTEEFFGPLYSTNPGLIDDILSLKKQWINENIYTGHIEAQLFDLSIKSFYYYHLVCVPLTVDSLNQNNYRFSSFPSTPNSINNHGGGSNQSSYNNYNTVFNTGYSPRSTNNNSTTQSPWDKSETSQTLSYSTGILPSLTHLSSSIGDSLNTSSSSPNYKTITLLPNILPTYLVPNNNNNNNILSGGGGGANGNNHLLPPQTSKLTQSIPRSQPNTNLKATRSLSESQIKPNLLPRFNPTTIVTATTTDNVTNIQNSNLPTNTLINNPINTSTNSLSNSLSSSTTTTLKNSTNLSPTQTPINLSPGQTLQKPIKVIDAKSLFKRWEILPHDQIIIEYLAEVVKDQQYYDAFQQIEVAPIIKLDYTPSVIVKNRK